MYSQFGVGPLLYLCCSSHVPLLNIFCPPVVPLMCSCSTFLVPLVPLLLFNSSSGLPLPFTWGNWEDLKMLWRGTLLSLFCSSLLYKITFIWPISHLLIEFPEEWRSRFVTLCQVWWPNSVDCGRVDCFENYVTFLQKLVLFQMLVYCKSSKRFNTNTYYLGCFPWNISHWNS